MKHRISMVVALAVSALAMACTEGPSDRNDTTIDPPEDALDLRAALGVSDLDPVGVTVEPETGQRYVLDADRGIFEVDEAGKVSLVWSLARLENYGVAVGSDFTDLAALGDGVFALTAISDGFLLDLDADTFEQHFCYEPGFFEEPFEEPVLQITRSVTFDPATQLIIAQPQTVLMNDTDSILESLVSTYDRASGVDLQWFTLPEQVYAAGGMALSPDGALMMGIGSRVDRFSMTEGELVVGRDLTASHGVVRIEGMSVDPVNNVLLILDGATDSLIEVPLGEL